MILQIITAFLAIWILLAIIVPSLAIPNFLLRKQTPRISPLIRKTAHNLKAKSKQKTLQNISKFVTINYTGTEEKHKLALYHRLFISNVNEILKQKQFLGCHLQNLVTRDLLLATNQFKNTDIERHYQITTFLSIHQYLIIKIDNQKFKLDPFYKIFQKLK